MATMRVQPIDYHNIIPQPTLHNALHCPKPRPFYEHTPLGSTLLPCILHCYRDLTPTTNDPQVTMMARGGGAKLKYVNAIPLSDLPKPGGATGAVVGGIDVCIAVGTDGLIYALGGKAPPTGTPMAGCKVSKTTIKDSQYGTE